MSLVKPSGKKTEFGIVLTAKMPQQDPQIHQLEQERHFPFGVLYDHQYGEEPKLQAKCDTSAVEGAKNGLSVDENGLAWPCPGPRKRQVSTPEDFDNRLQKLSEAVRMIIECVGEDYTREGLKGTPERYARAMLFFTKGYEENIPDIINGAIFKEDHNELVIVKDISIFSLCEHHMIPFMGKIHVGYIPDGRLLGLSKIARLAEAIARRLQVQERLTKQLALVIFETLKPQGVGVIMESSHSCMIMRGVQKTDSTTTTSCMMGSLQTNAHIRAEFLALLRGI